MTKCYMPWDYTVGPAWIQGSQIRGNNASSYKAQWSLYVPQWSLYVPPVLHSAILRSAHTAVFMCFVWISEQTAIISLYSIN